MRFSQRKDKDEQLSDFEESESDDEGGADDDGDNERPLYYFAAQCIARPVSKVPGCATSCACLFVECFFAAMSICSYSKSS